MLPVNVMSEILLISVLILEKRVPAISRFIVRLFCAFAEIKIKRTFATHLEKQMPAMIR